MMTTINTAPAYSIAYLRSQPPATRDAFVADLSGADAARLYYDWAFWARDKQRAPRGQWLYWVLNAGRGFGKTRTAVEWVRERVETGVARRLTFVGRTAKEVRDIMIEGESGLLACSPPWFYPDYQPSKTRVVWPNGAVAQLYSADEPDALRGAQCDTFYAEEVASWKHPEAWSNLMFGFRLGRDPRGVVGSTPKPVKHYIDLLQNPASVITTGSSMENIDNLAPAYIAQVITPYIGTRTGQQEIDAILLLDNPDALWNRADIDAGRVAQAPEALRRVVVGVDPPGSATGAECGIIVNARGFNDHLYTLDDRSVRGSPDEWGAAVVDAFDDWGADAVVAETNNGGDMVAQVIKSVLRARGRRDHAVPFLAVHASRGKSARAEPIVAMYAPKQRRAHHVGVHAMLETQMTTWVPTDKLSPDRLDAHVWGAWALFYGKVKQGTASW